MVKFKVKKMAKSLLKQFFLLPNVIDADHLNSCLFTNKGHFLSPSWVLIGVLAQFHDKYFSNSSNWTPGIHFNHLFSLQNFDPCDRNAACWFPLIQVSVLSVKGLL